MSSIELLSSDISPTATLNIRPWPDEVIDLVGYDPRSAYVEQFWLGVLGPSTTWILRRLASALEDSPDGCELNLIDEAAAVGLGGMKAVRSSPYLRALARLCQFELAEARMDGTLAVRRKVPPLSMRQVRRLPAQLAADHRQWQQNDLDTPGAEHLQRRCRRLALSLFELGEELDSAERQLARWRFPPVMCRDAALWARERHRQAAEAAAEAAAPAREVLEPTEIISGEAPAPSEEGA
ncbi:MAG: hypothetical protein ABIS21_08735 [Acidimicrobiales bacterium]